ncbi:hypothetical protein [Pelomonas sp. Root662]|uniref:hypothetical protein n=1 Tax=Pelomonas sp. Root662 TaxID=1736580 RepID=UPI0012FA6EB2|nr:hypothetical protein [Pelomonas sp. Root662]
MNVFRNIELLPLRPRPWLRAALTILPAVLAIALGADAARRYVEHEQQVEQARLVAEKRQAAVQQTAAGNAERDMQLRRFDEMVAPWMSVVSFPWDELLASTERLRAPGVRLVSLSVDAQRSMARVVLECGSPSQATELSSLLNEGYPLGQSKWRLLRTRVVAGYTNLVEAELEFMPTLVVR